MRLLLSLALIASVFISAMASPSYANASQVVSQVYVKKAERKLYLMNGPTVLRTYDIDLGFSPKGHKRREGDGRTPEGLYYITHRNPQSAFHLSIGISYPNAADRAAAARRGVRPGGDIFIHGRGPKAQNPGPDWTAGCLAVTDAEIEEIFRYVKPGTPIFIAP